jgi:hypothetical protein
VENEDNQVENENIQALKKTYTRAWLNHSLKKT